MRTVQHRTWLTVVGAIVLLAIYALPLYWLVTTSFKKLDDVFVGTAGFLFTPTVQAYVDVWNSGFAQSALNSIIIAVSATVLVLVIGVPSAYGLARVNGWIVNLSLALLIVLQMVPATSTLIPLYSLLASWQLTGNLFGVALAIAAGTLPFSVLLLRPFFTSVPIAIEEAASLDGAGMLRRFFEVVLPITRNGIATVGTLAFIGAWGEFLYAITFLTDPQQYPVSALLAQQMSSYGANWPGLMAVSVLVSVPTVLIFLFGQKLLVGGITMGSVR
ncbi:carbohydrate ABC transporter permease [Leifsonia poae]|uniref:carbohydrate ABC transporter permease n=1 Tax=Leifsonia poae TaxID=110933 RepID=UPI001CBC1F23|nr:carbohydrate ABC transporter permease [Leifsonia poae]